MTFFVIHANFEEILKQMTQKGVELKASYIIG